MSSDPQPFISPKAASLILAGIAITGAALLTFLVVYALWTGGVPTRTGSIYKMNIPPLTGVIYPFYKLSLFVVYGCLFVSNSNRLMSAICSK